MSTVPPRLWPRRALAAPVRAYRFFLSPWLGSACRFEPTCSKYTLEALEMHGAGKGSYLAARRVLRCHPWCDGGFDPVPDSPFSITAAAPSQPPHKSQHS
jgi:putative membrane protein insertion efficiency factor